MKWVELLILNVILVCTIQSQTYSLTGEIGKFSNAAGFSINATGFIYVIDSESNDLTKLDTLGNVLKFIGGYGWTESAFDDPTDIFANALNVYVADKNNNRIQFFDKDLNFLFDFNTKDSEDPVYSFAYPTACGVSNQGDLFVLDSDNLRILKYNLTGDFSLEIGYYDAGEYALSEPIKFAITPIGNLFVIDGDHISVFDQFGTGLTKFSPDIKTENINITFKNLVINSKNEIRYYNLADGKLKQKIFKPLDEIKENIIEALIFNNKFYVLTDTRILIFNPI